MNLGFQTPLSKLSLFGCPPSEREVPKLLTLEVVVAENGSDSFFLLSNVILDFLYILNSSCPYLDRHA